MFTPEWFVSLATIVLIDMLLAGDNAIVITLAARKLPPHLQKKSRPRRNRWCNYRPRHLGLTLLKLPGLSLADGLLLYWIAWQLLAKGDDDPDTPTATFWAAMRTIIITDTAISMGPLAAIWGVSLALSYLFPLWSAVASSSSNW